MNKEIFKKYFYIGLTVFLSLSASILLFFMLDKSEEVKNVFSVFFNVIKPFIYGGVIAYLLYPFCLFLEKIFGKLFKKMKNKKIKDKLIKFLSIAISLIFGFAVVSALLYLIIPQIYDSIVTVVNSIPSYIEKIYVFIDNRLAENHELKQTVNNIISRYTNNITQVLNDWSDEISVIVKNIGDGVLSVFALTKNIFIGIIVAVYLLIDRHKFKNTLNRFINLIFKNNTSRVIKEEIKYANGVVLNFISGRFFDSVIIGILCYVLMLILKLPFPALISVIVGVTNIIPFFGPFIGAIPSALLILVESPIKCLIFVIMIFILQQIDGNIIGPKIVGDSIGLSSFWVLFSILVFSGIFGVTGMLIGVPVFAIIYDIIKKTVIYFEKKKSLILLNENNKTNCKITIKNETE